MMLARKALVFTKILCGCIPIAGCHNQKGLLKEGGYPMNGQDVELYIIDLEHDFAKSSTQELFMQKIGAQAAGAIGKGSEMGSLKIQHGPKIPSEVVWIIWAKDPASTVVCDVVFELANYDGSKIELKASFSGPLGEFGSMSVGVKDNLIQSALMEAWHAYLGKNFENDGVAFSFETTEKRVVDNDPSTMNNKNGMILVDYQLTLPPLGVAIECQKLFKTQPSDKDIGEDAIGQAFGVFRKLIAQKNGLDENFGNARLSRVDLTLIDAVSGINMDHGFSPKGVLQ